MTLSKIAFYTMLIIYLVSTYFSQVLLLVLKLSISAVESICVTMYLAILASAIYIFSFTLPESVSYLTLQIIAVCLPTLTYCYPSIVIINCISSLYVYCVILLITLL